MGTPIYPTPPLSIPIQQDESDADPVHAVVIVEKALAIAEKVLDIAADLGEQRKAPLELYGTVILVKIQVIPKHNPEPVLLQEIIAPDLPVPHVFVDPWIIVCLGVFGKVVPALQEERKIAPFEADVRHDPVPAPRQGLGLAVRLVIDSKLDEAGVQAEKCETSPEV